MAAVILLRDSLGKEARVGYAGQRLPQPRQFDGVVGAVRKEGGKGIEIRAVLVDQVGADATMGKQNEVAQRTCADRQLGIIRSHAAGIEGELGTAAGSGWRSRLKPSQHEGGKLARAGSCWLTALLGQGFQVNHEFTRVIFVRGAGRCIDRGA